MVILFAILLVLFSNRYVETRRVIIGPRPSAFKFQHNGYRPHGNFGHKGWGNNGFGNSGWGNNVVGNTGWGANNFGNNGWGNNGWGHNVGGNNGWGVNNFGNNGWGNNGLSDTNPWIHSAGTNSGNSYGNHGFNAPNIIIVRPGPFGGGGTPHGQIIDVNVPPPKPSNIPKEEAKDPTAPQPQIPVETDISSNTQSTDETQGEIEPQVVIPPSPEENSSGDSSEANNTAAEEISDEQLGNPGNNTNSDENTAAEVLDDVANANADGSTTNIQEHNSESTDENESFPDLTDLIDVRFNLKTRSKENNTNSYSEQNSNGINRRNDNLCGIPGITTELGAVDKATLLPWLVTLGKAENAKFSFLCGGTLISPDVILTSAHCFHNNQVPTAAKIGEEFIMITTIIIHENYNSSQAYYNIALVKLSRPMNSTLEACLPNRNSSVDKSGMYASALEWKINRSEELPKPGIMASKIFSNSQCVKDYENVDYASYFPKGFDSTLLCVKLQMPFVCQGDSGIPLFSVNEENDIYTLIGTIANPETSCGGTDYPGIYTKISSFLPWIEETSRILSH